MWRQGEHVALIGSTGSGKTTLARQLLKTRQYRIALLTKADPQGWPGWKSTRTVRKIEAGPGGAVYALRPDYESLYPETVSLFSRVWLDGGWALYVDEAYYVEHVLKLGNEVTKLLTQGRSKHVSVVLGVQRPAWVSRFALSEPTHIFCSRLHDRRDIRVMAEIAGTDYADSLQTLNKYEFSYLHRDTMRITTVTRDTVSGVLSPGEKE